MSDFQQQQSKPRYSQRISILADLRVQKGATITKSNHFPHIKLSAAMIAGSRTRGKVGAD